MVFLKELPIIISIIFLPLICHAGYLTYQSQKIEQHEIVKITSLPTGELYFTLPNYYQNIQETEKIPLLKYDKSKLSYEELYKMVEDIVFSLPKIRNTDNFIKLVVETAIVESDGGYYFDIKNKGGLGITQVNYKSAKEVLKLLKKYHTPILESVDMYRDDNLSLKENLIHNVHFNLAMCVAFYYVKKGDRIYQLVSSEYDRARVWKKVYNTHEGVGTTRQYLKRVRNYTD